MDQEEVLQRLAAAGGYYKDDHIVLTSGRHSDVYANFRVFFEEGRKAELELFCAALAERFRDSPEIQFVVGPKTGGAIIAERVSDILSGIHRSFVRPVIAFKQKSDEKDFSFYADDARFLPGKCGLFVDDVLSTGSSLRPVETRINEHGARLIAMGVMLNRSGLGARDLGIPRLESLVQMTVETWPPAQCPLCLSTRPINAKVGHGAKHGRP